MNILIADDHFAMVASLKTIISFAFEEIEHVVFIEALNCEEAILKTNADYLLFTDGDCIPRNDFLAKHLKFKDHHKWEVNDVVNHSTSLPIRQLWHPNPDCISHISFEGKDEQPISQGNSEGWYSSQYGLKKKSPTLTFSSNKKSIKTVIEFKKIL